MQYYIKIFNKTTNVLVGFYKESGLNSISSMRTNIKYYDTAKEAMEQALLIEDGFIRDKDKHYYTAVTSVYGDASKKPTKTAYKQRKKEEELKDELDTFIRQNSSRNNEQTTI